MHLQGSCSDCYRPIGRSEGPKVLPTSRTTQGRGARRPSARIPGARRRHLLGHPHQELGIEGTMGPTSICASVIQDNPKQSQIISFDPVPFHLSILQAPLIVSKALTIVPHLPSNTLKYYHPSEVYRPGPSSTRCESATSSAPSTHSAPRHQPSAPRHTCGVPDISSLATTTTLIAPITPTAS